MSTYYLKVKFPTTHGIEEICRDQNLVRYCYHISLQEAKTVETYPIEGLDTHDELAKTRDEPIEDLIPILLEDGNKEHTVQIRSNLDQVTKELLTLLLQRNADIFTWTPMDLPGINPSVMVHSLNVDPKYHPFKQKKRSFAPKRQKAIAEEVNKLLDTSFIWEVQYPN